MTNRINAMFRSLKNILPQCDTVSTNASRNKPFDHDEKSTLKNTLNLRDINPESNSQTDLFEKSSSNLSTVTFKNLLQILENNQKETKSMIKQIDRLERNVKDLYKCTKKENEGIE